MPSAATPLSRQRSKRGGDTILLVAGFIAFNALVAYLAVSFWSASPHSSRTAGVARVTDATPQWTPVNAVLRGVSTATASGLALNVKPKKVNVPWYGAEIPTIVFSPVARDRFRINLSLKGIGAVRVAIEVTEFRPGVRARYALIKHVTVTGKWRHISLAGRVTRSRHPWTGLGLFIFDSKDIAIGSSFGVRDLKVAMEKA